MLQDTLEEGESFTKAFNPDNISCKPGQLLPSLGVLMSLNIGYKIFGLTIVVRQA